MKVVALLITFHLSLSTAQGQTFTQRVQQHGTAGGKVTIHQDASIDELVNGKTTTTATTKRTTTGAQPAKPKSRTDEQRQQHETAPAKKETETAKKETETAKKETAAATATTPAVHTTDSVTITEPVRTKRVIGYRIQVFAGGKTRADRQRAEQTGNTLRTLFPGHKVYVHFYSPRWICRMGNYRTMAEAKEMLDEVVRMGYDSATIVRGRITVPY